MFKNILVIILHSCDTLTAIFVISAVLHLFLVIMLQSCNTLTEIYLYISAGVPVCVKHLLTLNFFEK